MHKKTVISFFNQPLLFAVMNSILSHCMAFWCALPLLLASHFGLVANFAFPTRKNNQRFTEAAQVAASIICTSHWSELITHFFALLTSAGNLRTHWCTSIYCSHPEDHCLKIDRHGVKK